MRERANSGPSVSATTTVIRTTGVRGTVALVWELISPWTWSGLYKIFDVLISLGFYSIPRAVGCENSISKHGFGSFETTESAGWN